MASTVLEDLRKEARKLESTLDVKLVSYQKFGANFAHSTLLREDEGISGNTWSEDVSNSMALEIDQLLLKVIFLNRSLCDPSNLFI